MTLISFLSRQPLLYPSIWWPSSWSYRFCGSVGWHQNDPTNLSYKLEGFFVQIFIIFRKKLEKVFSKSNDQWGGGAQPLRNSNRTNMVVAYSVITRIHKQMIFFNSFQCMVHKKFDRRRWPEWHQDAAPVHCRAIIRISSGRRPTQWFRALIVDDITTSSPAHLHCLRGTNRPDHPTRNQPWNRRQPC